MRSLDIIVSIVTLLNSDDRLSLYCTSKAEAIFESSGPKLRQIRIALDAIEHDTVKPKAGYLRTCIDIVRKGLNGEDLPMKHLLVLTCNPFALERVSPDNSIQLHVLCPGPLPWTYFKADAIDGWFNLNQMFDFLDTSGVDFTEILDTKYVGKLLGHLRTGHAPDRIKKVSITIIPGFEGTVKEIIGSTFIESMNTGETKSILVRSQMPVERRNSSVLESFPIGLRTSSGQLDVERELDLLLNGRPVPQFKIIIKYEHSALSPDTTCEYKKDIFGRLQGKPAVLSSNDEFEDLLVQRRLAYHLVTSQKNPGRGFAALGSQFCANGNQTSNYSEALLQEVKYQSRIQERYELSKDRILPVLQKYSLFPEVSSDRSFSITSSSIKSSLKVESQQSTPLIKIEKRRSKIDQVHQLWSYVKVQRNSKRPLLQSQPNHIGSELRNGDLQCLKDDTIKTGRVGGHRTLGSLYFEKDRENIPPQV